MKKIYMYLAMVLVCIGCVIAGSLDDVQYYDRDRNVFFNNDAIRTISDSTATIDADTIQGQDVVATINENSQSWLKDDVGGGMSMFELADKLGVPDLYKTGKETFVDNYLSQNYPTFRDLALIQAQINLLVFGEPLNKESVTKEFNIIMERNVNSGMGWLCYYHQKCFKCW